MNFYALAYYAVLKELASAIQYQCSARNSTNLKRRERRWFACSDIFSCLESFGTSFTVSKLRLFMAERAPTNLNSTELPCDPHQRHFHNGEERERVENREMFQFVVRRV